MITMTSSGPRDVDALGVSFSGARDRIYLRAYPAPAGRGEIAITTREAVNVARQLASALHYLGIPWHQLYPSATDLPDEKGWIA